MNIFVDSEMSDDSRRKELYRGSLFIHSPSQSTLMLCQLAQSMIEEAFRPFDPLTVHQRIAPEKCVEILAVLKPRFIHHPDSKRYIQQILSEAGCDLSQTYLDVPRMRTAFPGDYLKSGIAYAFHPHRDTWYSAPYCQINWWMPIYDVNSENCMALHPHYFDRPIKNSSRNYNYHKWNLESRQTAAQHIKADTRVQPRAEEPIELNPQVRLVCKIGGAYQFSAASLHSTVPNTSDVVRYSIDFRTVHLGDVLGRIGAPNVDSECTGTTIGDYLCCTDFSHLPESAVSMYQDGTEVLYAKA
jgi:hypothetical protein